MSDERIIELETRLAYQEDLIQELNRCVFEQQQKIEHLETICKSLSKQTKVLSDLALADRNPDEKPPHY